MKWNVLILFFNLVRNKPLKIRSFITREPLNVEKCIHPNTNVHTYDDTQYLMVTYSML